MNTKNNTKNNANNNTKKKTAETKRAKNTTNTICISLDPKYVGTLDQLATKTGSRSAAIRLVLDEHVRNQRLQDLEAAYCAYFAAPSAAEEERALTEEMLSVARWPPDEVTEAAQERGNKERPSG